MEIDERFEAMIDATGDCWEWNGNLTPNGYGYFWIDMGRGQQFAHRVSYQLFHGSIPPGLTIDHLCRNHACVNPDHLEAVTQKVNLLRGFGPTGLQARQKACIHGHPFDEVNTYRAANGTRKCRICRARIKAASRQRLMCA